MRLSLSIIAVIGACIFASGCNEVSGGACDQIGSQRTDSRGQLWTCAKNLNTGKGYWYKGKP
jgi:hypothetical protein